MGDTALLAPEKIAQIEESFEKIEVHSQEFVAKFYDTLFSQYPHFKPLFSGSRDEQERKLFKTLMIMSQNLRKSSMLHSHFEPLGTRHAEQYHVMAEYYPQFIGVLIQTMREFAGAEWTPEFESAWQEGLNLLADMMVKSTPAR